MQTDERPPPDPWYKKLVSPLKNAWQAIDYAAEQEDPYAFAEEQERLRIAWEALRGRITFDEAERLQKHIGTREWWLNRTCPYEEHSPDR